MNEQSQSLYACKSNKSLLLQGMYNIFRFFLTGVYFGILIPMLTEIVLCLLAWSQAENAITFTDIGSAILMTLWSPIAFGFPAFLSGLAFAVFATLFKNRLLLCLTTSLIAAGLTAYFLRQYSYAENNIIYHISSTMLYMSVACSFLWSVLFSLLACTTFSVFFMPFKATQPAKKEPTTIKKQRRSLTILTSPFKASSIKFEPVLQASN